MTNNHIHNDDFIRKLIQKSDPENPSSSFTEDVMKKIEMLDDQKQESKSFTFNFNYWYFVAAIGMIGVLYVVYYFLSRENILAFQNFDPAVMPFIEGILKSFSGIFESFKISSLTIIIIAAIAMLFVIDQVLRRSQAGKYFNFTF
jgi:hypothetical protein